MLRFAFVLAALIAPGVLPDDRIDGELSEGWKRGAIVALSNDQVAGFAKKFGGAVTSIENRHFTYGGRACQVNRVVCPTRKDARLIREALAKFKGDPTAVRYDSDDPTVVLELYCPDASITRTAKYALGFQPESLTYEVEFGAVPLEKCDPMQWNSFFNLMLRYDAATNDEARATLEKEIATASESFEFGNEIRLRNFGQGEMPIRVTLDPQPKRKKRSKDGQHTTYVFDELPKKAGVPIVKVKLTVTSRAYIVTPLEKKPASSLTAETDAWPTKSPKIRELVGKITADAESDRQRVENILKWMSDRKNLRYGGEVVGSRYGTLKVIEQGFGHCWDYSDVFITLCRAADIPARQVLGWLYGTSGHVWCEVYVGDDEESKNSGWRAVDPTGVASCGSDYVPYFGGPDGEVTFVYGTAVALTIKDD